MKNQWKPIVICFSILAILACLICLKQFMGKIPSNDISLTGNTGGNLNNHGLFAESDGVVYFSNAYDGGRLYSMNADESDLKQLTTSAANSINVGGKYLYYYLDSSAGGTGLGYVVRTFGIYRSRLDGSNTKCLDRQASITMQLVGDYLYYQRYNNTDYTKFYKIKTDKSEQTLVSDEIINPAACHNGIIYFNGTGKDHYLYALDTRNDSITTIYEGNLWYPVYAQDYIYFMDVSSNYSLCRYSLSSGTVETLTTDRLDTYNVGSNYIYYQRSSETSPALMRMGLDGSNPEVVAEGVYTDINLTSYYAYFHPYGASTPIYHTPVNGPVQVTEFDAAKAAAQLAK